MGEPRAAHRCCIQAWPQGTSQPEASPSPAHRERGWGEVFLRMTALLRVVDLHKSFGATEVLKGVDLDVTPGETITVIGPSGSGKTTLLRCINYLERPTSGHVYIEDRLVGETWDGKQFRGVGDRELAKERTEMGMVFQRFNLWPHLSALDNVTLGPIRVLKQSTEQARAEGRGTARKGWTGAQGR